MSELTRHSAFTCVGLMVDYNARANALSIFATVKARTQQTKGAGSREAGLALAFKLALGFQEYWRKVNAPHLILLVRAGVEFRDGKQVTPYPKRELLLEEEEALRIAA